MAVVREKEGRKYSGKMNKKSNVVHRVTNGREYTYSIENPYMGPASDAQKNQRKLFGKINSVVNNIMANPEQTEKWTGLMNDYNHNIDYTAPAPFNNKFKTLRSFVFAVTKEQMLQKTPPKPRRAKTDVTLPKGTRLYARRFPELSAKELYEILKARFKVFVCEQHIDYLDEDDIDYTATHFALRQKAQVLAYARLYETSKGTLCVGRMLTTERNKGYGKYLLSRIIAFAKAAKANTLTLHAQLPAVDFYSKLGFETVGEPFIEADIQHVRMDMTL